jgi:GTPase
MAARASKSGGDKRDLFDAAAQGLPAVVIVGRVNAGKSTLFNRIVGRRRAIASAIPGTTRDINLARVSYDGRDFIVADSGGLELGGGQALTARVVDEAMRAVGTAALVIFLLDGRAGLSPADREAISIVRQTGRPIVVAVNKIDNAAQEASAAEFFELGAERLFLISAAHGRGVTELLDEIVARLPQAHPAEITPPDLRVALIGRPNVGKSSLLNRLVGFARAIVHEMPGTTRDTIDVPLRTAGRNLLLIDTAGIRRRTRVTGELEHRAVARALATIRRAEVLLLVIDAVEGITDQDARLARMVDEHDRGLVLVVNKWDAAAKLERRVPAFVRDARERFPFLEFAPMVFTSALTGDGVDRILPAALQVGDSFRAVFQTARLNKILADATAAMDPPVIARRRLNLMYVTQVASSPPRLRFFSNIERDIPEHYIRFLEGRFRAALGLTGTPLRMEFRRSAPPRSERASRPNVKARRNAVRDV